MTHITNKQQLVEAIRAERAEWEDLLATVGEARMTQPGAMGDWTFKDFIAHMTAWRDRDMVPLIAAWQGTAPRYPWPKEWNGDQGNQPIYDANKDRPLADILQAARATWERFEAAVHDLSEDDLFEPGRFEGADGKALGPSALEGFANHWHDEHEADIRAWLDKINMR